MKKKTLNRQSDHFKQLSKKVDLKPLTHVFENLENRKFRKYD